MFIRGGAESHLPNRYRLVSLPLQTPRASSLAFTTPDCHRCAEQSAPSLPQLPGHSRWPPPTHNITMAVPILKRSTRRFLQSNEGGNASLPSKPTEGEPAGHPSLSATAREPAACKPLPESGSKKTGRRLFFGLVTTHEFDMKKPACVRLHKDVPLTQATVSRWESDASSSQFQPKAKLQRPVNRSRSADDVHHRPVHTGAGGATPKLPNRRTSMEMLDSVVTQPPSETHAAGGAAPKLPSRRTSMEMMLKEETIITVRTLAYASTDDSVEEHRAVLNICPRQPHRVESEEPVTAEATELVLPLSTGKQKRRGSLLAMFQSRYSDDANVGQTHHEGTNSCPRQPRRVESEEVLAAAAPLEPCSPSGGGGKSVRRSSLLAVFHSHHSDGLDESRHAGESNAAVSANAVRAKRRGSLLAVLTRRNSKEQFPVAEEAPEAPSPVKPKRRGGIKPRAEYGRRARRHDSMEHGSALKPDDDEGCNKQQPTCRRWSMASSLPSRRLSLAPTNPCYAMKEGHASPVVSAMTSSNVSTASTSSISTCGDQAENSLPEAASPARSGRRWSLVACLPGSATQMSGVPPLRTQSMPQLVPRSEVVDSTALTEATWRADAPLVACE